MLDWVLNNYFLSIFILLGVGMWMRWTLEYTKNSHLRLSGCDFYFIIIIIVYYTLLLLFIIILYYYYLLYYTLLLLLLLLLYDYYGLQLFLHQTPKRHHENSSKVLK